MKKHNRMRPQDIFILMKLLGYDDEPWQGNRVALALGISPSEVSEAVKRCEFARLLDEKRCIVNRKTLLKFIIYGLPYVFPVRPGGYSRGIPTAHSSTPMTHHLISTANPSEQYVWPDAEGEYWGLAIEPLYPTVPKAVRQDQDLHELLALIDVLRVGRPRERNIAEELLVKAMNIEE